jgi:hypothetical protein
MPLAYGCYNYTIGTPIRQTVYAQEKFKYPQTEKGTKNTPNQKIRSISCLFRKKLLLHSLFDSNSHGNGHTDHGGAKRAPPVAEEAS